MQDILTVTLNPAVDLSTAAPEISPGHKLRCAAPNYSAGGGGINVSRAIRILGGHSRAFVAHGGNAGQRLQALLSDEGIAEIAHPAPGETRTNVSVICDETGEQFRFVMPGPTWTEADCIKLLTGLNAMTGPAGLLVLSGSLAPGMSADFARTIIAALKDTGPSILCDISGRPLRDLCAAPNPGLDVLRMDLDESEEIFGAPLSSRTDSARFARDLVAKGVSKTVIVARGPDGSVLASEAGCLHATALDVPINSKVGAGDSFVGAFTLARASGLDLATALQHGTTAATSAVTTPATELCRKADFERYLRDCVLSDITL
ncbi:6-phosphofructokinase isozyme 2 [Shimia sp. SK013]|uniref:1-phosphofructokinase family hexose kinase n=1 Tax=Shimia sp. SK013 TaxID=1389006 RepID=UPI0006B5BE18|nr:1-phosphofructokinase family hexose kinase [Shimia sp. SK013]KPA20643.1 6-phosphofructokinase isozyme 2 [Shimia sp. SK013]